MRTILTILFAAVISMASNAQTAPAVVPNQISGMVGFWDFENIGNLNEPTSGLGSGLVVSGSSGSITQIAGPEAGDMAITKTTGKYLNCIHGIAANGGGSTNVNKYSLLVDFRVPTTTDWKSFYQTNTANSNDGDFFMNNTANIGIAAVGYSPSSLIANQWYRLLISVDCGNEVSYYIDGQKWVSGNPDVLNGRFSLDLNGVLLFADDNGEDGNMDISKVVLFDRALNASEALLLGGYGHSPNGSSRSISMSPYLQTPTTSSIYISWHSVNNVTPEVKYGTSASNLNQTASGSSQLINGNANYRWHTVKLTGLSPNTEYFYKCYSGSDSTPTVYPFKTQALRSTPGQHFRFIALGDNRTNVAQSSSEAINIAAKLTELYGPDYHKYVNLICSEGDIVTSGSDVTQYEREYFTPFAPLTKNIPSMISIGNHENNSTMFFDYMKYEELTDGYSAPNPYNEKFYQFSLGSSQFLFLNANTLYRIAPQTTWVNDRLNESQSNPDIDFVFSFTHQPGHSEVWPDGNENYVQTSLFGALKTHHKSAIHFDGHSHNYERGIVEMVNSDSTKQHDMRQVLSGGAGSALDRWGMYSNQTNYYEINKSMDIYCWTLIDIDIDNKSYKGWTYSFGNASAPKSNIIVDSFYRKINQSGPLKAKAAGVVNSNQLVAFPMQGVDSAMTCHFQVTATPGNYSTVALDRKQDKYDVYGDSGAPNWAPTDLNANLDIKRLLFGGLTSGQTYGFRVRYKDNNLEWGKWSDEKTFVFSPGTSSNAVDFVADSLNVPVGYAVSFTDLSGTAASSWAWDFNNDGTVESTTQDPTYSYSTPGFYTVSLKINGSGGSVATKNSYIHVYSGNGIADNTESMEVSVSPNPFQSNTSIRFDLEKTQNVDITISDISGKLVRRLQQSTKLNSGVQNLTWDGKSDSGAKLASGSYFISIKGETVNTTKTIILE